MLERHHQIVANSLQGTLRALLVATLLFIAGATAIVHPGAQPGPALFTEARR